MVAEKRNRVGWLVVNSCARRIFYKQHRNLRKMTAAAALAGLAAAMLIAALSSERLQVSIAWKSGGPQMPLASNQATLSFAATAPAKGTASPVSAGKSSLVSPSNSHVLDNSARAAVTRQDLNREFENTIQLETIRGAVYKNFFRIVFQFTGKISYKKPVVNAHEAGIRLSKVTTRLKPFRRYKTFDAWARLDKNGNDLNVRIGLPQNFLKLDCFELKNPHRLVVNIFTK